MIELIRFARNIGIALGSLVAASLVMWLVGWILPVPMGWLAWWVTLLLGGLIYTDIRRRDRPVV